MSAAFQHCDNRKKTQARTHVPKPFTTAERGAASRENAQFNVPDKISCDNYLLDSESEGG